MTTSRDTPVVDILPNFLSSLGLEGTGNLHRFRVAGRVQRRIQSTEVEVAVAAAKARRKETGQPFWDALFTELPFISREGRQEVLGHARYHNKMSDVAVTTRFELTTRAIRAAVASEFAALEAGQIIAVSSRLLPAELEEVHVPMLDFRLSVSEEHEELVPDQLRIMKQAGWLVSSGRSYHFLGHTPLKGREAFVRFLGEALLFSPIVDGRWVAHQLIEGASALRISSGNDDQILPRAIAELP